MADVHLKMKTHSGKEIYRIIDITNAMDVGSSCWTLPPTDAGIRKNLEAWIKERGNKQHETQLELISFTIFTQQ